jgi:hypothetical protein
MARRKVIHLPWLQPWRAGACSVRSVRKKRVTLNLLLLTSPPDLPAGKGPVRRPIFHDHLLLHLPDAFEKMLAFVMATRKMVELRWC